MGQAWLSQVDVCSDFGTLQRVGQAQGYRPRTLPTTHHPKRRRLHFDIDEEKYDSF